MHIGASSNNAHNSPYNAPNQMMPPPQIGMVHPQSHGPSPIVYAPGSATYGPGLERQRSYSNPRKFTNLFLLNLFFASFNKCGLLQLRHLLE
jgi:hypothetical protein